jgi:class 3 adenylate cyclase
VLKTVLFTDIVSSTELLSARGDAQWRHQLDAHDRLVDSVLMKYSGSRVKHTGDGVFALLDGPTKAARCALELAPALAARGISIRAVFTWTNASGAATSEAAWRCTSAPG